MIGNKNVCVKLFDINMLDIIKILKKKLNFNIKDKF